MMSPTPKPECSEAAAAEACSRSRRFPANARKTSPSGHDQRPRDQRHAVPGAQLVRMQDRQRQERSERRGDAENHRKTQRQPHARDSLAEQKTANSPSKSEQGNLGQHRAGGLLPARCRDGEPWPARSTQGESATP